VLTIEIKKQVENIEALEYRVQQIINESVIEKQNLRKRLKELNRKI
jgi:hypothetical protein